MSTIGIRRLNWGSGTYPQPGWTNSDQKAGPGIDLACDIRHGLPLPDRSFDYAVSIHALPEMPWPDLVPALAELRRVLRPGAPLRIAVPDVDRAIAAYQNREAGFFLVPDSAARSLGGKLVTQLTWYGYTRSLFTRDFVEELLLEAGYARVDHCSFGVTRSAYGAIVELDDRETESLFVEGTA